MTTKNQRFPRGTNPSRFYNLAQKEAAGLLTYDLPARTRYGKEDHLKLILAAGVTGGYAEGTSAALEGVPTGETVLSYLGSQDEGELLQAFWDRARRTVDALKRRGKLKGKVPVAIDWHDVMYYGSSRDRMVVGTKPCRGSSHAFEYLTASVIVGRERAILCVVPISSRMDVPSLTKAVIKGIGRLVKVRYLTLDAGFFNADLIGFLREEGIRHILHMPQNPRTRKMGLCHGQRFSYTQSGHRRYGESPPTFDVTVAFDEAKEFLYLFVTDMECDAEKVLKLFLGRWGIETGYRVSNQFLARTTSKRYVVRLFYYLLACLLYNLWIVLRCEGVAETAVAEVKFCILRIVLGGVRGECDG